MKQKAKTETDQDGRERKRDSVREGLDDNRAGVPRADVQLGMNLETRQSYDSN